MHSSMMDFTFSNRAKSASSKVVPLSAGWPIPIIMIMTGIRLAERMGQLGTESAFEVLARAKAMEAAGSKVIHLEIGEPDFPTAEHISRAAIDALLGGQTHYVPAPGIPALRQAVAAFL